MGLSAEAATVPSECGTVCNYPPFLHRPHEVAVVRTGQVHRTLLGHTGPITCLQFDEIHIMSGSLDKTVQVSAFRIWPSILVLTVGQVWDLRSGGIFQTIKYDHAVTALQFDTRKIVAATGENAVKVNPNS